MDQVGDLYEHITTENTIQCSKCKTIGRKMDIDPYDAAGDWILEGWKITRYETISCPKCNKSKKK
jgi:hypothetical protein